MIAPPTCLAFVNLILPLVAYFLFAVTLTWLAALARDRFEARKRRAWRE